MKKRKKWSWNLRCNTVVDDNEDNIDGVPSPKRRRIQENDPLISSDDDDDTDSSNHPSHTENRACTFLIFDMV